MAQDRSTPVIATYVLSMLVALALLVVWVVYVVGSVARIREVAGRVGLSNPNAHWAVLAIGSALLSLLIVGLTYQLAQTLAARRYSQKQEEFLSNVTHEMKSPLAAIKLHAQTLESEGLSGTERSRSTRRIVEQAERMSILVDQVLESSRLLAGKRLPRLEPVAAGPFFRAYLAEAEEWVENQGMKLSWSVASAGVVRASTESLERVMNNLLENAVRFSHRGGEVRCRIEQQGEVLLVEVEDDGIGIPKGELGKVFDRFYQIGREIGGRRRGTGLGLSIVSGLVAEMGGTVRAISQDDRPGTRFTIDLPLAEEEPV